MIKNNLNDYYHWPWYNFKTILMNVLYVITNVKYSISFNIAIEYNFHWRKPNEPANDHKLKSISKSWSTLDFSLKHFQLTCQNIYLRKIKWPNCLNYYFMRRWLSLVNWNMNWILNKNYNTTVRHKYGKKENM